MLKFGFLLCAIGVLFLAYAEAQGQGVKFYIHTNRNKEQPQLITADVESIVRSSYFALDPTILSLPRWQGTKDSAEHRAVIDAQLKQKNSNVIVIDWSVDDKLIASTAADEITALIVLLHKHFDVDVSQVQAVGFSEGAHIAGLVGQQLQQQIGAKIQRITALDPSKTPVGGGSGVVKEDVQHLLSANDAAFVEVIHTNAGIYGIDTPVGHVDYYPNGGRAQPNCEIDNDLCAHERAYELLREMWSPDNDFISAICSSNEGMSARNCRWLQVRMGQNFDHHGVYYLETNGVEPYSKGSFYIAFL